MVSGVLNEGSVRRAYTRNLRLTDTRGAETERVIVRSVSVAWRAVAPVGRQKKAPISEIKPYLLR